jgi:hypothetical protein
LYERGATSLPLSDFSNVLYVLIARDHVIWVEPSNGYPVIEFESFKKELNKARDLQAAVSELLTFKWLPVEGRDFVVRFEPRTANGVTIESEVFYPC